MKALSPMLKQAWQSFANNANWAALHPLDLQRFGQFTNQAHRFRRTNPVDFAFLIREACPDIDETDLAEIATELTILYDFGRILRSAGPSL